MESTFWIAKRYDIPLLLIVLNNGGWNAPKVSALLVHKSGYTSQHNRKGEFVIPPNRKILEFHH
jgi:thiamine pyrophosphate-dependent acetolactate synthase large subunit-like protein